MTLRSALLRAPQEGAFSRITGAISLRLIFALLMLLAAAAAGHAQGGDAAPVAAVAPQNAWNGIARVIISPWMTIALLTVGCLLLFIELLTLHTWGITGTLGAAAVLSVFAAHIVIGDTGWIGVLLFLAGLALLVIETHFIPGFGVAGVAGLMLLFAGMFWSLGGTQNALFALSVSTILTVATIIGFFAYLPKSPVWKTLGQQMQQRASLGYVTAENMTHFLGRAGKATTPLRPAGLADIDGLRVDVVTEGEFLETGTPIVVIKVEGSRIVVDEAQAAATGAEASGTETRAA